ncbi:glycoside hydrolase [Asticcacaulis sp. AC402]|nr:glycoside hydrolase [Asticcacaulis sp. AC402]
MILAAPMAVAAAKKTAAPSKPIPELVEKDGKFALMVDGAPFLILGGQANNSSNYPAALKNVWPAIKDLNANTLVMPVAWEQVEPVEGQFDFSFVDALITQARQNKVRLVILWFGTWKNTGPSYTPSWVKTDNKRFPRLTNKDGSLSYALSPLYETTREADKRAYVKMMEHIKAIDSSQRTVIMIQPQNEVGVYGAARDYSAKANGLMAQPVPQALLSRLNKNAGTWNEVFGKDADEFFHAWSIASYVDHIAAAGKAVYPLPTYMNAALKDPLNPDQAPGSYASGGPTYNVIEVYQAAAPNIDFVAPDLYSPGSQSYEATLAFYARKDNPLFVAESGNKPTYARFIFSVLGRQGIGFDPFGFDYSGYSNYPLGTTKTGPEMVKPFGELYSLFRPLERVWPKLSFESQVWGVSEPDDHSAQTLDLGPNWNARVTYRQWEFGMPEWDPDNKNGYPEGSDVPSGGVAVAKLSDNEFLVAGYHARISFGAGEANKARGFILDRVEEGHYDARGNWVFERVWNGDQTDYGLNFAQARLFKVRLATFEK